MEKTYKKPARFEKLGLFVCFCTDCKHPLMNNENKFFAR